MEEKLSYEEALAQLQTIVKKLENKEVKIDELAGTVARANQLVEYCQTKLQQTEVEIQKIVKKGWLSNQLWFSQLFGLQLWKQVR